MNKPNSLCIDFESWIFSKTINAQNLSVSKLRKLDNNYTLQTLDYLIKILKKYRQKTTFFVVIKLEELYPGIIGEIIANGHEVGWHTYSHPDLTDEKILKDELEKSEKYLKKYKIKGFQAPRIYFFREGYKLLKKYGFVYSSSIYGNSDIIYNFDNIYEIPVSVSNKNYRPKNKEISFPCEISMSNLFKFGIPFGSSFFWSILGKKYYFKKISEMNKMDLPVNLFIHDWQLVTSESKEYKKDVGFLKLPLFLPYRKNVSEIFEYLLSEFSFQPLINNFI